MFSNCNGKRENILALYNCNLNKKASAYGVELQFVDTAVTTEQFHQNTGVNIVSIGRIISKDVRKYKTHGLRWLVLVLVNILLDIVCFRHVAPTLYDSLSMFKVDC